MGDDNWDDSGSDTGAAPPPRAPAPVVPRAKPSKWADEDVEEKPASDWEASSEEEAPKATATAPPKKRGTIKSKIAEKEAAAAAAGTRRGAAGELDPDEWRAGESDDDDKGLSVAEQRARELESDLKSAGELLGAAALGDAPSELAELASFDPRSKEDFQKFSNMIIEHVIQRHQSKPLYATFVEMHVRALAESLRDVDIRKAASALSALGNEKQKEQRDKASGKKKPKAAQKPGLGLSKPGPKKVDTTAYEEPLDDFGDEDFM
ncbi:Translation initiation factor 3 subunit J component [Ceratobasidium sp. 414]|nr:Translation initiation factor 3 subunit J component [Ceratobasidium sp. 414]